MSTLARNSETVDCTCAEGLTVGKDGLPAPTNLRVHSCLYVRRRNSFLDRAAACADALFPEDRGGRPWSRCMTRELVRLLRQADPEVTAKIVVCAGM
jgi:hypothetical protein